MGSLRIPRGPHKGYSFIIFGAPCGYADDAFDPQGEPTHTGRHKPGEGIDHYGPNHRPGVRLGVWTSPYAGTSRKTKPLRLSF